MPDTQTPVYDDELFVERQETEAVIERARQLAGGNIPDRRTVIFVGQRGAGKSWLLKNLYYDELPEIENLKPVLLNLEDYAGQDIRETVVKIFAHIWQQLFKDPINESLEPKDLTRELVNRLPTLLKEQVLVLLVDSAYESSWELLAALENYLLGPLASEPRVLIVITGRGRPYPWKTPEMRLRADFHPLAEFNEAQTEDQVNRCNEAALPRVHQIYELSQGNPLANYLLATRTDSQEALNQVINDILEAVPATERATVRDYLEALSVLSAFDEERIIPVLAAYNPETYGQLTYAQAQQVRQTVVKYAFAEWSKEEGGYVLNETIRNLLTHYLKKDAATRTRWQKLHCAALNLYLQWMANYQRTRDRWAKEAETHKQALIEENFNPADCS